MQWEWGPVGGCGGDVVLGGWLAPCPLHEQLRNMATSDWEGMRYWWGGWLHVRGMWLLGSQAWTG